MNAVPPVPAGQHTPPAEAADAAAEAQACEHCYASKHQPGHSIYWVRQCMVCHEIDWDDLDRQIEQFGAEVPLVPGAQVTTEALAAFKAARPSMTAAICAAQRRTDETEFATRMDTWQQAMAATIRKAAGEARAEERERLKVPELLIKFPRPDLTQEALDAIKARFIEAQKHGTTSAEIRNVQAVLARDVDGLIAQAVAEEREACAELAEGQKEIRSGSWYADRIRQRGES